MTRRTAKPAPLTADPIRAAGTLDLTVHRRDVATPPRMHPSGRLSGRYRAFTQADMGQGHERRDVLAAKEWVGHAGATVCGRRLLLDELWVAYDPESRDRLCPDCWGLPDDTVEDVPMFG